MWIIIFFDVTFSIDERFEPFHDHMLKDAKKFNRLYVATVRDVIESENNPAPSSLLITYLWYQPLYSISVLRGFGSTGLLSDSGWVVLILTPGDRYNFLSLVNVLMVTGTWPTPYLSGAISLTIDWIFNTNLVRRSWPTCQIPFQHKHCYMFVLLIWMLKTPTPLKHESQQNNVAYQHI